MIKVAIGIGAAIIGVIYLESVQTPPTAGTRFAIHDNLIVSPPGVFEQASVWLLQPHAEGERFDSEGLRRFIRRKGFTCDGTVEVKGIPKAEEISCGVYDCNAGYIYTVKDYGGNLLVTPWMDNRYDLCEAWKNKR